MGYLACIYIQPINEVHIMKQNKLAIAIVIISMMMTMTSVAHAQDRIERIGDKEYQQINDQWFYLTEQADTVRFSPERLIVRLKDSAGEIAQFKQSLQLNDLEIVSGPTSGGYYVLQSPAMNRGFEVKRVLLQNLLIASIEFSIFGERLTVPNDEKWSDQWNLPKVEMPPTWDITKGNPDVVIGIVDSGALLNHPDLQNCLWDDIGYNFLNPGSPPDEVFEHGTPVSGIIGAQTNNTIGVAGIAGCWDATSGTRLMILKDGNAVPTVSLTAEAIEWAADNGASVVNISTGYPDHSSILQSAVNYATNLGVTIVASAGNNGGNGSSNKSIR